MKETYSTFKTLLFLYNSVDFVVSYADWIILLLFFFFIVNREILDFVYFIFG